MVYADAGAEIASGSLVPGHKYFVFAAAYVGVQGSTRPMARLIHGATEFPGSETNYLCRPNYTNWSYMTLWTAVLGEALKIQWKSFNGSEADISHQTIFVMDLENLVENVDYFFDENAAVTSLDTSWSALNNAAITFTPAAASDWLVMTQCRILPTSTTNQHSSRIERSGEASSTSPVCGRSFWDPSEIMSSTIAWVFPLTGAPNTFTSEAKQETGSGSSRTYSSVFALNLAKFQTAAFAETSGAIAIAGGNFTTQVQTKTFTPAEAVDHWILSQAVHVAALSTNLDGSRQQLDGADVPAGQTADPLSAAGGGQGGDNRVPWNVNGVSSSLSAAPHTVDVDIGGPNSVEERLILAIGLKTL